MGFFSRQKDIDRLTNICKELCPHKQVEELGSSDCYECELCGKIFYCGKPRNSKVKTIVYK